MKTLVVIANYGTANDGYLRQVLDQFQRMQGSVDIVVTSNLAKNLGPNVEVAVGFPTKDPRSLAFAHKRIFAERLEEYDLFIYTEDDTPITQTNIDAFLKVTEVLPQDEIAGFLRTETAPQGSVYFPEVHNHFHWDPSSFCSRGEYDFAFFTDDHAGCYVLTRRQLRHAIASGGFLVPFHEGQYPPLETAATDPYTQCGFRKMMCVSHFERFIVPHLSNKYAGNGIIVAAEDFYRQLRALQCIGDNGRPETTLFPVETRVYHRCWSKNYYEPCHEELASLIPARARNILSIGCGWGEMEKRLIEMGARVKAIPMDSVIAASAESKGVEIVYGDAKTAREKLAGERFDCLLFSNVLHLVPDPVEWLTSFAELLAPGGSAVASAPNLSGLRRFSRWLRLRGHVANPKSYEEGGMHPTTANVVRRWFRQAGLQPEKTVYAEVKEHERLNRLSLRLATPALASNVYISGILARPPR